MQGAELREMEWAPPKEAPPFLVAEENPPEEYGPWQWAASFGRATGRFGAEAFTLQENGRLRCPAGASLWLSEVRQENAFTRAGCLPGLPDRLSAVFPAGAVPGERRPKEIGRAASVLSAVSCLHLPLLRESPSCSERCAGSLWPVARFAVPGPPDFRRHYVEVLPLTETQPEAKPPPRPPRAVRQASSLELAGSARTQRLVGTSTGAHHGGFRTRVSHHQRALGGIGKHRSFFQDLLSPL